MFFVHHKFWGEKGMSRKRNTNFVLKKMRLGPGAGGSRIRVGRILILGVALREALNKTLATPNAYTARSSPCKKKWGKIHRASRSGGGYVLRQIFLLPVLLRKKEISGKLSYSIISFVVAIQAAWL